MKVIIEEPSAVSLISNSCFLGNSATTKALTSGKKTTKDMPSPFSKNSKLLVTIYIFPPITLTKLIS